MKNKLIVAFGFFIPLFVFGQSLLQLKSKQLNIGAGLSGWGIPFYAGIDYSVHKDITIGGEFSGRSYEEHYKNSYYSHSI